MSQKHEEHSCLVIEEDEAGRACIVSYYDYGKASKIHAKFVDTDRAEAQLERYRHVHNQYVSRNLHWKNVGETLKREVADHHAHSFELQLKKQGL